MSLQAPLTSLKLPVGTPASDNHSSTESKTYGPVQLHALVNRRITFHELEIKPKEPQASSTFPLPTDASTTFPSDVEMLVSNSPNPSSSAPVSVKGKNKASRATAEELTRRLLYPDSGSLRRSRRSRELIEGGDEVEVEDDIVTSTPHRGGPNEAHPSQVISMADMPGLSTSASSDEMSSFVTQGQTAQTTIEDMPWLDPALFDASARDDTETDV